MTLRRASMLSRCVVQVKPVGVRPVDFGARRVAALVLIAEPGQVSRIDSGLVAATLGLTPAESRIAVWLAEGKTVREMATAPGRRAGSVYWSLNQIYRKQGISRQADLVRLAPGGVLRCNFTTILEATGAAELGMKGFPLALATQNHADNLPRQRQHSRGRRG